MIFETFLMTSFLTEKARLAASVSPKESVTAAIKISVNHYVNIISGALHCAKSVCIRSFLLRSFSGPAFGPEKLQTRTLFTQCLYQKCVDYLGKVS